DHVHPGRRASAAPTDPVRPRRHAPIRSKELTMLTFKEALCLLAIVIAYGITGRMDYEDALLMEQVRQQVGADCILPLEGDDTLPEVGPTGHPPVGRPIEGIPPEAPCVPDAASDQPMRLTRH
ncbi:MAG: hypothetical protein Q8R98_20450, partial [Rubrivivax sp.]|nr:hypothetical protein [Rubrivivax sp.]